MRCPECGGRIIIKNLPPSMIKEEDIIKFSILKECPACGIPVKDGDSFWYDFDNSIKKCLHKKRKRVDLIDT